MPETFPPNSPEPRKEIRVVRYEGTGTLYERTEFNLWSARRGSFKGLSYLWDELNHEGDFRTGPETFHGAGCELVEVEEFTQKAVQA